jgi:hypothetical protein
MKERVCAVLRLTQPVHEVPEVQYASRPPFESVMFRVSPVELRSQPTLVVNVTVQPVGTVVLLMDRP